MLLSRGEFDARRSEQSLRIALIGMSNIGKSHWARFLKRQYGFHHYEVDDRIQESLSLTSIASSANWMGNPYDKRYAKRSESYLALEAEMTLGAERIDGNLTLDTTGSVIHLAPEILEALNARYLTIYLQARDSDIDRLVERFKTTPKPLIWGDHYEQKPQLTPHESMLACYRDLLIARNALYSKLSDITLAASRFKKNENVLEMIKNALPAE